MHTLNLLRRLHITKNQGSSFPGLLMRRLDPNILETLANDHEIIVITGTNGKTTTALLLHTILTQLDYDAAINASGANLENGITLALARAKPKQLMVLEVDEAAFAACAGRLQPHIVVVTNLFRDQLDRYGELDAVYHLIERGLRIAPPAHLLLDADDPKVAALAHICKPDTRAPQVSYFGMDFSHAEHSIQSSTRSSVAALLAEMDAASCPSCSTTLLYDEKTIAHLGEWRCPQCGCSKPVPDFSFSYQSRDRSFTLCAKDADAVDHATVQAPLEGLYNAYNLAAAAACARVISRASLTAILDAAKHTTARFGRQERLRVPHTDGKSVCFVLVKNPAGYSQALRLVAEAKDVGALAFCLNDGYADGTDVSWIWDVPFEQFALPELASSDHVAVMGTRAGDMALRLSYWGMPLSKDNCFDEDHALKACLALIEKMPNNSCLYILPNYTSLLHVRARLTQALGYDNSWTAKE